MFTVVMCQIQPMGAVKTMYILLSYVVRLQEGQPGILTFYEAQHFINVHSAKCLENGNVVFVSKPLQKTTPLYSSQLGGSASSPGMHTTLVCQNRLFLSLGPSLFTKKTQTKIIIPNNCLKKKKKLPKRKCFLSFASLGIFSLTRSLQATLFRVLSVGTHISTHRHCNTETESAHGTIYLEICNP